jgi:hypothetical protein
VGDDSNCYPDYYSDYYPYFDYNSYYYSHWSHFLPDRLDFDVHFLLAMDLLLIYRKQHHGYHDKIYILGVKRVEMDNRVLDDLDPYNWYTIYVPYHPQVVFVD